MAENKTIETRASVTDFINKIEDEAKRQDSFKIVDFLKEITGYEPKMWGPSIIGFGNYHYRYESGREGDFMLVGFSPRKSAITFYLASYFEQKEELLNKLGKHKTGKGCLYVKKLNDIDLNVLKQMVLESITVIKERYSVYENKS